MDQELYEAFLEAGVDDATARHLANLPSLGWAGRDFVFSIVYMYRQGIDVGQVNDLRAMADLVQEWQATPEGQQFIFGQGLPNVSVGGATQSEGWDEEVYRALKEEGVGPQTAIQIAGIPGIRTLIDDPFLALLKTDESGRYLLGDITPELRKGTKIEDAVRWLLSPEGQDWKQALTEELQTNQAAAQDYQRVGAELAAAEQAVRSGGSAYQDQVDEARAQLNTLGRQLGLTPDAAGEYPTKLPSGFVPYSEFGRLMGVAAPAQTAQARAFAVSPAGLEGMTPIASAQGNPALNPNVARQIWREQRGINPQQPTSEEFDRLYRQGRLGSAPPQDVRQPLTQSLYRQNRPLVSNPNLQSFIDRSYETVRRASVKAKPRNPAAFVKQFNFEEQFKRLSPRERGVRQNPYAPPVRRVKRLVRT